jgi:hypothetical protein
VSVAAGATAGDEVEVAEKDRAGSKKSSSINADTALKQAAKR